jgi:hypothetical protein
LEITSFRIRIKDLSIARGLFKWESEKLENIPRKWGPLLQVRRFKYVIIFELE